MAISFYKSVDEDGGAIGDILTNGGVDELLPIISSQDRINGTTYIRKYWIKADVDSTVFNGLANDYALFRDSVVFKAGDDDHISDIVGDEPKYGTMYIQDADYDNNKIQVDNTDLVRVDDYVWYNSQKVPAKVLSVDETDKWVELDVDLVDGDLGAVAYSCSKHTLSADDATAFWIQTTVPEMSNVSDNYDTHYLFCVE